MKANNLLLATLGIGSVVLLSASAQAGIEFNHVSLSKAAEMAKAQDKLIFVDVYASWCGPCKYLSENVFTDDNLGNYYNQHFVNVKLDGETTEGREAMERFSLDSYPSLLYINAEGELISKRVGASEAETFMRWGKAAVDPEATPMFMLTKRFDSGDRDREFLAEYMRAMMEEGLSPENIAHEYLEEHASIDLENEDDLLAFVMAADGLEKPFTETFLESIESVNEASNSLCQTKVSAIIHAELAHAVTNRDRSHIKAFAEKLFPAYVTVFADEAFEYDELLEVLESMYDDEIN